MTTVTALLVSHDGARWLPAVLDGLASQTRPVDAVRAVDTSSSDGSADLLRDRLGHEAVLAGKPRAAYGETVAQALGSLPPMSPDASSDPVDDEWVWLLHDDSNPAPDALERLLEAAAPEIAVLGPKLREWPSLRRLLELGVTISGTGRRETGLERGEYDQGQHDRKRDVLAVNTAGMLVRRSVLEQIGFDPRLPVFGNDIDFGWRAARAGHRTVVVPEAVVFHAEAAHRGVRRTELTGRRFHRAEREAALYTLLVNGSGRGLPFRVIRLFLGSLLRMVGFLLVRSPGEAYDELGAVAATFLRPDRILAGRNARRRTSTKTHQDVKHLLAPVWLPYRHGLDFVSDVASAVVNQATDLAAARRGHTVVETGPADEDTESIAEDGLVARLVVSPIFWAFAALMVLAAVGMRGHFGSGMLSGGALLPAPDGAHHWWSTAFAGAPAPSAPYLLPLALTGTLLLGKAWLVVDLLLFFAVPLAAWGAFRFLRRLTGSWQAALWGGVAYGLVPVLSGSVQQGRIGTVAVAIVLPWMAHSAYFLAADSADRRTRAAFRTALWLALAASFAPLVYVLALVAAAAGVALRRDLLRVLGLVLGVALALLLPWALLTWWHDGLSSWLLEAGLPASDLLGPLAALDIVFGRPGAFGAPGWLTAAVVLAGALALVRTDTRSRVLVTWAFVLLGLLATALLAGVRTEAASTGIAERVWLGVPLLLVQAALITAAAIAGAGIREQLAGHTFGWRQPVGVAVALAALVTPLLGLVWWGVQGTDGAIDRREVSAVPSYITDASEADAERGVLVLRGNQATGFRYLLLRQRGLRLGDDSVLPAADDRKPLTGLVGALASSPADDTVEKVLASGVQYVYAPAPVDQQLAGNLDSLSGVIPASSLSRGSRAWKLDGTPSRADDGGNAWHPWLVALQCAGVVVAGVFAAPSRKREVA